MSRVRTLLLSGVFGALGFGTSSAEAQSVGNAPASCHSSAPSGADYGWGSTITPQPFPRYDGRTVVTAPAQRYLPSWGGTMRSRTPSVYFPSGRYDRIARPWLR